ncbi:MAG: hypothetical protein GX361_06970 [Bacteroidales bacterium]|nr:hypothetical protein [Bacteroidales bacterium]
MKKTIYILAIMLLGTCVTSSQVKVMLEKDYKARKTVTSQTSETAVANDSVGTFGKAEKKVMKSAEEIEAIINELSYKNRPKGKVKETNRKLRKN